MDVLLTLAVLGGFGYFIYTRVKKGKEERANRSGGGSRSNDGKNTNKH